MSEHFSTYAIVIAFSSLVISLFMFILNFRQSKIQRLSSESQFINNNQKKLDEINRNTENFLTKEEWLNYTLDYLNVIDRICFFEVKDQLQDNIIEFFSNYLEYALRYYNWIIEINFKNKDTMLKDFPHILDVCKKLSIKPCTKEILFIDNYVKLPDR